MFRISLLRVLILLLHPPAAWADQADVVGATVKRNAGGKLDFSVTVRHADEGWDHYADRWEILGPDGKVLATRVLQHPHVEEQPVTRTLENVDLPKGVVRVTVRAHDSRHGLGGKEVTVDLPPPLPDNPTNP